MQCSRCNVKFRHKPNRLITNFEGFALCHACYKSIGRQIYLWLSSGPKGGAFVYPQEKRKKGE